MQKNNAIPWNLAPVWNRSYEVMPQRHIKERDYLYASELAHSHLENYMKMAGIKPTNPPNARALRKFAAGMYFESFMELILLQMGILVTTQESTKFRLRSDLLEVSGRLDFVVGGEVDFDRSIAALEKLNLTDSLTFTTTYILKHFQELLQGRSLEKCVLELKSCSSMVYDRNERSGCPSSGHDTQLMHYLIGKDLPGKLLYIDRDSARLLEFQMTKDDIAVRTKYEKYIEEQSFYYYSKTKPPMLKPISFNTSSLRFETEWRLAYSNYLTLLLPQFANQGEFTDAYKPLTDKLNRVYKRYVTGENITAANKKIVEEGAPYYSDWDEIVNLGKVAGVVFEEETEAV